METEFINIRASDGPNSTVGTYEITHATADTGMGRIGPLIDAVIDRKDIARLFREADCGLDDAFAVDAQFDGPDRAHGSATATEGACLLIPEDLPGKIAFTHGRGVYLSH
jgi:hypothetical protein